MPFFKLFLPFKRNFNQIYVSKMCLFLDNPPHTMLRSASQTYVQLYRLLKNKTASAVNPTRTRRYASEVVDYGIVKKSRSLFDIFSKKEPNLDPELVKILRCPISKKPLRYDAQEQELIQDEEGIVYHVVDGIPILTPSAAKSLHVFVE
jgi:uncharacterized protein YbaR (Trm112 family)